MQPTAMIVDEDPFVRKVAGDLLRDGGFQVLEAGSLEVGIEKALDGHADLFLVDLPTSACTAGDICRLIRSCEPFRHAAVLLMSDPAEVGTGTGGEPFLTEADDYLLKPFDGCDLVARAQGCLAKRRVTEAFSQRADGLGDLLEITGSLRTSRNAVDVLKEIVGQVAQLVDDVDRCSISLIQEDQRSGYVLASSDDPNLSGVRIDLGNYPEIREVIKTGKPFIIDDVGSDPLMAQVRSCLGTRRFRAVMVIPVVHRRQVFGALIVRVARAGADISRKEMELCQLVASISANAFQRAGYFEEGAVDTELLKSARQALAREIRFKAVYEQLFEHASEGLAAFDRQGRVVYANLKAQQISGYSREELASIPIQGLLSQASLRRMIAWKGRSRAGRPELFDVTLRTKQGAERILSVGLAERPVFEDLVVASFRDLTERRQMERELKETRATLTRANERLKKLDRARAEFINTAAHELRTPVTIINGYCSLIEEVGTANLTEKQRQFLHVAIEHSERLVELINNMLDLSRFEAGKMIFDILPHDLSETIRCAGRELLPLAARHHLELEVEAMGSCPAAYDAPSIHRVLVNLVGNAVKYTPPGGRIQLSLREDGGEIIARVADTGKGIPPERLADLFEEFVQLGLDDASRGSGLGLSICRKIVEAHGGRIWAESAPGQGSCFSFSLPSPPA